MVDKSKNVIKSTKGPQAITSQNERKNPDRSRRKQADKGVLNKL